ncbi:class I SAM-dependent methyltransferase [uncultured Paludibaculum sp.]|uniref:class I SAM-dependent methyltransferase n=1 Tax=uncultured Paludibaculum sp. TaxID=1765020 RepID=UPI002AAB5790|nr:class I SAM-dependent methyltransferase [uncultured Paludibaculum sp.]
MSKADHGAWDELGQQKDPSWYLDPLVAAQKREAHLRLIQQVCHGMPAPRLVLKTDLFEEAFGADQLLGDFPIAAGRLCGIDTAVSTTTHAGRRFAHLRGGLAAADLRRLPFRDGSFDLIISTSSLDHFDTEAELAEALNELARVLAPGGALLMTFDNGWNPFYYLLRWSSAAGLFPFPLGRTPSPGRLPGMMRRLGLEPLGQDWLIHNPRGLSTLLFLGLRRLLGWRAGSLIAALIRSFARLERLPTRRWTACFAAVWARKEYAGSDAGIAAERPRQVGALLP